MNNTSSHLIRVEVTENGEVVKADYLSPADVNSNSPIAQKKKKTDAASAINLTSLQNTGRNILQNGLGRVGSMTGNYNSQSKINNATKMIAWGTAIAVNPLVGTIGLAVSLSAQTLDYALDTLKQNRDATFLREQTGLLRSSGGRDGRGV